MDMSEAVTTAILAVLFLMIIVGHGVNRRQQQRGVKCQTQ